MILLLIAAGIAIVLQNRLMAAVAPGLSGLVPLWLNSATGLAILSLGLTFTGGWRDLAAAFRPSLMVPGVLGTFFVFACLTGYRQLGAAPTIALVVAAQLIFGFGSDLWAGASLRPGPALGVGLMILGAVLILFRS